MNQRLFIALEKEINNFKYIFHLPVGASWVDAIVIAKEFAEEIEKMAKNAEEKEAKPEEVPVEEKPEA